MGIATNIAPIILGLIMFGLGLGLQTKDFLRVINHPKNFIVGLSNLFRHSKHFIVGPSSFHWLGAWLNNNPNKICLRPKNISNSSNLNYWPDEWKSI